MDRLREVRGKRGERRARVARGMGSGWLGRISGRWNGGVARRLLAAGVVMAAAVAMPGCARKVYVPVERVEERVVRDSALRVLATADTVRERDSVVVAQRGDTVFKETYRVRREVKVRRDTVVKILRDTVRLSQPVVVAPEQRSDSSAAARMGRSLSKFFLIVTAGYALFLWLRRKVAEKEEG